MHAIAETYARDQTFVREFVEQPWLHVADSLLALQHGDSLRPPESGGDFSDHKERLESWRRFGGGMGIDEVRLRQEGAHLHQEAVNGLTGCSWIRCPLHEVNERIPGREFLACSRCHSVWSSCDSVLARTSHSIHRFNIAVSAARSSEPVHLLASYLLINRLQRLAGRRSQTEMPNVVAPAVFVSKPCVIIKEFLTEL